MAYTKVGKLKYFNSAINLIIKRSSTDLKDVVARKLPKAIEEIKTFRKQHGSTKIGEVTVNMVYGGMRGVLGLLCETSEIDPEVGIMYRGYPILQCQKILPKMKPNGKQPLPESAFWLLMTGDIPTDEQVAQVSRQWAERAGLPQHVVTMLNGFPKDLHPMTQYSCGISALSKSSHFANAYRRGVKKTKLWESAYEDAMDLIAKITGVAAIIYNNSFRDKKELGPTGSDNDWALNFCKMINYSDTDFHELMRLYLTIHADHEGGNVSAHTCHLVGSALSDPYLSFAAGMNGLAGPLHGLANQEALLWIQKLRNEIGDKPSDKDVEGFVRKTLQAGQVIPGYGHAVLRKTDPRYIIQKAFAENNIEDDPTCNIVDQLFRVVPRVLKSLGKVANPYPNVDAHSGALLSYYGMKETQYYTVLFGISRALGALSSYVWSRALGLPIERPKSISSTSLMKKVFATKKERMRA